MRGSLFVFTALAAMVSGCASPGTLRSGDRGTALLDRETSNDPQKVAGCIADRLDAWPGRQDLQFATRPTEGGYSISGTSSPTVLGVPSGTDTVVLVDIRKKGEKTEVQLFTHFLIGDGHTALVPLVSACL